MALLACLVATGAGVRATPQTGVLCDSLAAKIAARKEVGVGATDLFLLVTQGPKPVVELAKPDPKGLSLDRSPAAPDRVMFEKRLRSRFGNAEALIKELRNWDFLDIMTLPGSDVHMVLSSAGSPGCESRLFFKTTVNREVAMVPDPPVSRDQEGTAANCETSGARGHLARIDGVDAFLEYQRVDGRESFRIVPLTSAGWQTPCTFTSKFTPVLPAHAEKTARR